MKIEKAIEILMDIQSNWEDGEVHDAFNLALESLEEQLNDKWISVSERLPEYNKPVLLYLGNGKGEHKQVVGYLFFTEKESFKKFNNEFSVDVGTLPDFLVKEYIKAWRELPEEYKEKPNEG